MRKILLLLFRYYFKNFPIRKGKMPVLSLLTKSGLTNNVKLKYVFDDNIKINLDLDDWIQKLIYFYGYYEIERQETFFWKSIVKNGQTIFDVGANIGYYSLLAAKINVSGTIYAFEPVNETFNKLKNNISMNEYNNIIPFNFAISANEGPLEIYPGDKRNTGTSSISNHIHFDGHKQTVKAITIDGFVKENNMQRLDLVKIDVEGAEMMVLKGMENTLDRLKPTILIELIDSRLRDAGSSLIEVYEYLHGHSYKPYMLQKNRILPSEKYLEGSLVIFIAG